jgi:hypothetical protein
MEALLARRDYAGAAQAATRVLAAASCGAGGRRCGPCCAACEAAAAVLVQAVAAGGGDARAALAAAASGGGGGGGDALLLLPPPRIAALLALADIGAGRPAAARAPLAAWFAAFGNDGNGSSSSGEDDVAALAELYAVHVLLALGERAALAAFLDAPATPLPPPRRAAIRQLAGAAAWTGCAAGPAYADPCGPRFMQRQGRRRRRRSFPSRVRARPPRPRRPWSRLARGPWSRLGLSALGATARWRAAVARRAAAAPPGPCPSRGCGAG